MKHALKSATVLATSVFAIAMAPAHAQEITLRYRTSGRREQWHPPK